MDTMAFKGALQFKFFLQNDQMQSALEKILVTKTGNIYTVFMLTHKTNIHLYLNVFKLL